jgi:hypothetical protein
MKEFIKNFIAMIISTITIMSGAGVLLSILMFIGDDFDLFYLITLALAVVILTVGLLLAKKYERVKVAMDYTIIPW